MSEAREQLISYAREQRDLAHSQLDERYEQMIGQHDIWASLAAQTSIAHSLAAIASLMLADKEVAP